MPSPNVLIRKIIVDNEVVVGHLDSCATHCFVSIRKSAQLSKRGNVPFMITPFPVGQGVPLPDATKAHLCSLWMVSSKGTLVGFDKVLFLVVNTGAEILIANNLLDYLGILRYEPPTGYEQILLQTVQDTIVARHPPPDQGTVHDMIRTGLCMFTELNQTKMMETSQQDSNLTAKNQDSSVTFVSKQKEPGKELRQEIRKQKIETRGWVQTLLLF